MAVLLISAVVVFQWKDILLYTSHLSPLNECLWFIATCTLAQLQKGGLCFVQIQCCRNICAAVLGGLQDAHAGLLPH